MAVGEVLFASIEQDLPRAWLILGREGDLLEAISEARVEWLSVRRQHVVRYAVLVEVEVVRVSVSV